MAELTKERIEQFIKSPLDNGLTRGEQMEMARQLLAGMEHEPVGITDRSEIEGLKRGEMANVMPPDFKGVDAGDEVLLYAAPQLPQPVQLPDVESYLHGLRPHAAGALIRYSEACRAAMLKHSAPFIVTSDHRMMEMPQVEDINAVAAMLHGAEPVSQPYTLRDGWVAVPVEPTAEMVKKMRYHCGGYDKNIKDGYKAMLAAAPQKKKI